MANACVHPGVLCVMPTGEGISLPMRCECGSIGFVRRIENFEPSLDLGESLKIETGGDK